MYFDHCRYRFCNAGRNSLSVSGTVNPEPTPMSCCFAQRTTPFPQTLDRPFSKPRPPPTGVSLWGQRPDNPRRRSCPADGSLQIAVRLAPSTTSASAMRRTGPKRPTGYPIGSRVVRMISNRSAVFGAASGIGCLVAARPSDGTAPAIEKPRPGVAGRKAQCLRNSPAATMSAAARFQAYGTGTLGELKCTISVGILS